MPITLESWLVECAHKIRVRIRENVPSKTSRLWEMCLQKESQKRVSVNGICLQNKSQG